MTTRSLSRPQAQDHDHFLTGLLHRLHLGRMLRLQRNRLRDLDDHLLADIGLTREQATREAERRDWPAPDHWKR